MGNLVPRQEVFDTYWGLGAERLAAFYRRVDGQPAPWTQDPILQQYKFCHTFRAADRESQYLIRQLYEEPSASKADLVFRATAMRTFSKGTTWDGLKTRLGHQPTIADLDSGAFLKALDDVATKAKGPLYTSGFILAPPSSYGYDKKHRNHVALFQEMFVKGEAGDRIAASSSLGEVYEILHAFPYMGDFMSYQTAIDINYSSAVNFSENDFTKPGPGAVRGLGKVFESLGGCSPEQAIQWMVEHQDEEFARLGLDFPGLYGRRLHAIDCQGLFCETDKYSRIKFPHLESERSEIKNTFKASAQPIRLFFPPKWGINDRLPAAPVLGQRARQLTLG